MGGEYGSVGAMHKEPSQRPANHHGSLEKKTQGKGRNGQLYIYIHALDECIS